MKYIVTVVMYSGFFGLIAFTVYYTHSGWGLWALLLFPTWKSKGGKKKKKGKK